MELIHRRIHTSPKVLVVADSAKMPWVSGRKKVVVDVDNTEKNEVLEVASSLAPRATKVVTGSMSTKQARKVGNERNLKLERAFRRTLEDGSVGSSLKQPTVAPPLPQHNSTFEQEVAGPNMAVVEANEMRSKLMQEISEARMTLRPVPFAETTTKPAPHRNPHSCLMDEIKCRPQLRPTRIPLSPNGTTFLYAHTHVSQKRSNGAPDLMSRKRRFSDDGHDFKIPLPKRAQFSPTKSPQRRNRRDLILFPQSALQFRRTSHQTPTHERVVKALKNKFKSLREQMDDDDERLGSELDSQGWTPVVAPQPKLQHEREEELVSDGEFVGVNEVMKVEHEERDKSQVEDDQVASCK